MTDAKQTSGENGNIAEREEVSRVDGEQGAEAQAQVDWQAKAEENRDAFLRARAELDNVQKRNERQLDEARKFAIERFARDLLPVKDSLEMALATEAAGGEGLEQLRKGVELTLNMLNQTFERFGIRMVDPVDQRFDPNHHLAIATVERAGESNQVVQVHQKGYVLNERLLRPAMVSVSKAPGKAHA